MEVLQSVGIFIYYSTRKEHSKPTRKSPLLSNHHTINGKKAARQKWDSIFFSPLCPQFIRSTWSKSISLDRTSNSLESGWDWITNRGEPLSGHFPLSFSLSPSPLGYLNKMSPSMFSSISERQQIHYFWLSFSVTRTCPSGLFFCFKSMEV